MLSSIVLLFIPFSLLSTAAVLPRDVDLGPGEDVNVQCQGATVTETVYVTAATGTPGTQEAGRIVAQTSASEEPPAAPTTAAAETQVLPSSAQTTPGGDQTAAGSSVATPSSTPDSSSAEQAGPSDIQTAPRPSQTNPVASAVPSSDTTGQVGDGKTQYRNALYFTNWGIYGANYQPQALPGDKITHVLYAFADIASDGEVVSSDSYADLEKHYPADSWNDQGQNAYGCVKQLYLLKKKHRHMKTLLSIGGWTYSPKFAPVARTAAGRERFCNSSVTLLKDWGFDGLDIDWEYPADESQASDYVELLRTCRRALDAYAAEHAPGYRFLLTVAAPAGPQNYKTLSMRAMDALLDAWHLMAYDYAGSWDSTTGHQANLFPDPANPLATKFSTDRAVRDYAAGGVPPAKVVLGMPLYGRAFGSTKGLGQPYAGVGPGALPGQAGIWPYRTLPRAGAAEAYDDVAGASYSFDSARGELISYDNLRSAAAKVDYLLGRGLGGAVFWEASGDRAGNDSLVGAVARGMGALDRSRNWLAYPASRYDNIRAGVPGG